MIFSLKIHAKEQIRDHYIGEFLFVLGFILLQSLQIACLIGGGAVYAVFFVDGTWLEKGVFGLCFLLLLCAVKLLCEIYRVFLYRKFGNTECFCEKGLFYAAIRSVFIGGILFLKKFAWLLVLLTPGMLGMCSLFLLSEANMLYPASARIVFAAMILLFAGGIFFAFAVLGRFAAVRFFYVGHSDVKPTELFRRNERVFDAAMADIFRLNLSLIPWGLLGIFLPAAVYVLPYLFRCRLNGVLLLCSALEKTQVADEDIKIYNGKGTPAKDAPIC